MVDLINSRENYKDLLEKKTALRVFGGGNLLSGVEMDDVVVTYPTSTTERFDYYYKTVLQATILTTYSNASKTQIIRIQRL